MPNYELPLFPEHTTARDNTPPPSIQRQQQQPARRPGTFTLADRLMKLRDFEQLIARHFSRESRPSRSTLVRLIEDGTILGTQLGRGRNYYVIEASGLAYLDRIKREQADLMALAA